MDSSEVEDNCSRGDKHVALEGSRQKMSDVSVSGSAKSSLFYRPWSRTGWVSWGSMRGFRGLAAMKNSIQHNSCWKNHICTLPIYTARKNDDISAMSRITGLSDSTHARKQPTRAHASRSKSQVKDSNVACPLPHLRLLLSSNPLHNAHWKPHIPVSKTDKQASQRAAFIQVTVYTCVH